MPRRLTVANAVRQRIHGARTLQVPRAHQADIVRDFKKAWKAKDIDALIRLLDPDAVMTTDSGGQVAAALRPQE